jgi:ribosomal protein L37AE/L43A
MIKEISQDLFVSDDERDYWFKICPYCKIKCDEHISSNVHLCLKCKHRISFYKFELFDPAHQYIITKG